VRWRVYHDGFSFFALYPRAWNHVLGDNFRDFEYLYHDLMTEPIESGPQVIIVEPTYHDAPHFGSDHANDNHAPLAVGWGEEFLRRTYDAVIANPDRWKNTVMAVYYDEHGGFYDHVPPPLIGYTTTGDTQFHFDSLGPRIPGLVISPFVEAGAVSHALLDNTSVLQLLAERFTPGQPYSPGVEARAQHGVQSISALLTRDAARTDTPPAPSQPIRVESALGANIAGVPDSDMQRSLENAATELLAQRPVDTLRKYPELAQWQAAVAATRTTGG